MTTALLVMDMQNGIVERFAGEGSALIDNVSSAIAAARSHGTEVIFVRVAFRPDLPRSVLETRVSRHWLALTHLAKMVPQHRFTRQLPRLRVKLSAPSAGLGHFQAAT